MFLLKHQFAKQGESPAAESSAQRPDPDTRIRVEAGGCMGPSSPPHPHSHPQLC